MNGAFSPLRGYMDRGMYEGILERMRLPNGLPWSMPITLVFPTSLRRNSKPVAISV